MQSTRDDQRRFYVGMHDGVCAFSSADAGKSWQQGPVTPLAHAAARLSASPTAPQRAYLAAYEAGVYRTDDGGLTWRHLASYPADYAHSVLVHRCHVLQPRPRCFVGTFANAPAHCRCGSPDRRTGLIDRLPQTACQQCTYCF